MVAYAVNNGDSGQVTNTGVGKSMRKRRVARMANKKDVDIV